MANQSMRQEIIQSIVNSQLQQAIKANQQEESNKIRADFENWQKQTQEESNKIRSDFDAWMQANPLEEAPQAQPVQPIIQATQTKAEKKTIPSLETHRSIRNDQEEEKMLAKEAARKQAVSNAATNETRNRLNVMTQLGLGQHEDKGTIGENVRQLDLSKYNLPKTERDEAAIKQMQDLETAKEWTDANHKLTKEEQKEAKRIAREGIERLEKRDTDSPAYIGRKRSEMTPEEQKQYDIYKDLETKSSSLKSFAIGAADKALDYGKAALQGVANTQSRKLSAENKTKQALGIDTGLSTKELKQIEPETRQNIKQLNEDTAYARSLGTGAAPLGSVDIPVLGKKDITPYGLGQTATQFAAYGVTNPAFDMLGTALGAGAGIGGKVAGFVGNQVGQNMQDYVLETSLVMDQVMNDPTLNDQQRADAIIDSLETNAIGNLAAYGLLKSLPEGVSKIVKKWLDSKAATEATEDVVTNAAKQYSDAAAEIERLSQQIPELDEDITASTNRQFTDLMNTFNSQFKDESAMKNIFSPEDMEASQNAQLKSLMEQNLIPERLNPEVEMEGLEEAIREAEELKALQDELPSWENPVKTPKVELPAETNDQMANDFMDIYNSMNPDYDTVAKLNNEKATAAFENLQAKLNDYEKAAFGAENVDEVVTAKKAVNAARKRLERAVKDVDPEVKLESTKYRMGELVGKPEFRRTEILPPDEAEIDELVNDWINNENPNKWVRDAEPTEGFNGRVNLQTFGGGNADEWATSKLRTNSMEKTGLIKDPNDIPAKEYQYKKFGHEAQREAGDVRYADSKDIVRDLVEKDAFDEVDMRKAGSTWRELMQSDNAADIRRANKLGHKMSLEGREGGRLIEAIKEMNRNTPEGMVQEAQDVLGQATDKRVGKGTSEALDNLYDKVLDAYDNAGTKEEFAKKVEELLQGDLKKYVSPKTAKDMQSKNIKGAAKILKMINNAESLEDIPIDDVMDVMYKQNGGVTLSTKAQKEVYDLLNEAAKFDPESYEFRKLQAQAARKVMAEAPSGLGDYIRTFLYDNMLGNFKTAFSRNFLGNVAYQSLEKVREIPTAAADAVVSKFTGKRSALGWNAGKAKAYGQGFKKGAVETGKDIANSVNTNRSGQHDFLDALKNNATVHNDNKKVGHFLNQIDFYVENAMKGGDRPIYEANYAEFKTELEQLLDRYGKNGVVGLENVEDQYIPETIDGLAKVRAMDAVFQKKGHMSEGLSKMRDGLGELSRGAFGVDILSTASTPFTLTPGNMLERAVEYTPVGLLKNAVETALELRKGGPGFNQRRFVEELGRTTTGLPVLYAAYQGAKKGLVNGGYSTDPDEKAAQLEDGFIEYGLNVPEAVPVLGGKTLDTSDLPVYGPFMQAGAVMAEEGLTPEASLQAAEAVAGGSALQGLRKAFGADNATYSSQNGIIDNMKNTVLSSGSQFVPSLLRQTAQTIDPYKRDMGEYGTNEYYANLVKNSIPGLRQTLPIKTNVEGEPVLQNQGRPLGSKILENYVLPMNMSEYTPSELNEEASRLRQSTGDAWGFAPKAKRSDLRSWDEAENVEYSEAQFREYKEELGKGNAEVGNALIDSRYYSKLDDAGKNKALQDAYSAVKAAVKHDMTGADTDDKLAQAYMKGGTKGLIKEMTIKGALKSADVSDSATTRQLYDDLGEVGLKKYSKFKKQLDGSTASEDIERVLNSSGMMKSDKAKYYSYLNTTASPGANPYGYVAGINYKPEKDKSYQKAKTEIPSLKPVEYYKTKDTIDADASSNISQEELINYITVNNLSDEKAQQYWAAYGGWTNKKGETKKLVKKNGKWVAEY